MNPLTGSPVTFTATAATGGFQTANILDEASFENRVAGI
jgi:hypothetical protein